MILPRPLACAILSTGALFAQDPTGADIDAIFARYDAQGEPGLSVGVIRDGELVHARGYGLASLEHAQPNGPDTVFRIGSTSKQFTAACIALLVLRGELDLEADVHEFFPEMWEYPTPLRVRHLVHHTSGVRDYVDLTLLAGGDLRDFFTPEESLAMLERQRSLAFAPGERWQYSNSNYLLLGEIVRRVSGSSLAEFARVNLFEPLAMETTHYQDNARHVVRGRAWGYSPGEGSFVLDITNLDHVGDGGVFTTVRDLARWDANFYECALPEGQAFLDLMYTTGVLSNGEDTQYAFGLFLEQEQGQLMVSHGGAWVGYRAELLRFQDEHLSVIVLANRSDVPVTRLALRVADLFFEDDGPEQARQQQVPAGNDPEPAPRPSPEQAPIPAYTESQLERYTGSYWSPELECSFAFALDRGRLVLERAGTRPRRLKPAPGANTFRRAGTSFVFRADEAGAIRALTMSSERYGAFVLERD